jgi:hypothetical protein
MRIHVTRRVIGRALALRLVMCLLIGVGFAASQVSSATASKQILPVLTTAGVATSTPTQGMTSTPTETGTAIAQTATPTAASVTTTPIAATATPTPTTYTRGQSIVITWPYVGQVWESAYWDQPDGALFNELPGPGDRCSNPVDSSAGPLTATCSIPLDATPGYHTITLAEFYNYNGGTIADQALTVYVSVAAQSTATPTKVSATPPSATPSPAGTPQTFHPGDAIAVSWIYVGQVWESAYWDQPDGALFNELPGPGDRCSNPVDSSAGPLTATCSIPSNATPGYHTITLAEFYNYNGGTIADQALIVYVAGSSQPPVTSTHTETPSASPANTVSPVPTESPTGVASPPASSNNNISVSGNGNTVILVYNSTNVLIINSGTAQAPEGTRPAATPTLTATITAASPTPTTTMTISPTVSIRISRMTVHSSLPTHLSAIAKLIRTPIQTIVGGDALTVRILGLPKGLSLRRAAATLTVALYDVLPNSSLRLGSTRGASKSVTKRLFATTVRTVVDKLGRVQARIHMTYRPRHPMRATLITTVRTALGLFTRQVAVSIVPPNPAVTAHRNK